MTCKIVARSLSKMMLICADSTELVYSIPKFVFICRCGRRKASELSILEEKWFLL
jgi:hypothetical protein